MNVISSIRSAFGDRKRSERTGVLEGSFGNPSLGNLMDKGHGELGESHDEQNEPIHLHEFGTPNDVIEDHVRPPLA